MFLTRHRIDFILFAISLAHISRGIVSVCLPLYLHYINVSLVSMGFIFALAPMILLILMVVVGAHSDVVGRNRYFSSSFGIASIVYLSYNFCRSVIGFMVLNVFDYVAGAMMKGVSIPIIIDTTSSKERGRMMGIYTGVYTGALAFGMLISGFLIRSISYFWVFVSCSVLSLIGATTSILLRGGHFRKGTNSKDYRKLLDISRLDRSLKVIFLTNTIQGFGYGVAEVYILSLFLRSTFKVEPSSIGMIISLGWLGSAVTALVAGRLFNECSSKRLYVISGLASAFSVGSISIAPTPLIVGVCYGIFGVMLGILTPARLKIATDYASKLERGRDIAISEGGIGLGTMLGAAISGLVVLLFGMRVTFVLDGFTFILMVIIAQLFINN